jgi:amino-acid N-acetyltransferase
MIVRPATPVDVPAMFALVDEHRERGHLLPRTLGDLTAHAHRFYVAEHQGAVVGCAEAAPLSARVAEVRSLVVDAPWRGNGVAGQLVAALHRRARLDGHEKLCAFAHDPAPFLRLGFSIVPHAWLPEKISTDCVSCPLFRQCGQYALLISLPCRRRLDAA